MKPFQWRPAQLTAKLDPQFEPILESHSVGTMPRGNRSYFVLAKWGDAGYMASARRCVSTEAEVMQENYISLDELQWHREKLHDISIPLRHSVGAFAGSSGTIRVYHSRSGGIDFHFKNTEQLEWQPLLNFILDLRKSLVPDRILQVEDVISKA